MNNSIAEKQRALVEDLGFIENRKERLGVAVDRGQQMTQMDPEERIQENLIDVCQSPVWVSGEVRERRLYLKVGADSGLVRGLVGLMCEIYDGGLPEEILAVEPTFYDELGLAPELSPTRKNGLAGVRRRIRELAEKAQGES